MNKATNKARNLAERLRTLDPRQLATATGGGQAASTSRSGTPEAGDDTVGDQTFGGAALHLFLAPSTNHTEQL